MKFSIGPTFPVSLCKTKTDIRRKPILRYVGKTVRVALGIAVVAVVGGALYYFYYVSVTKTMNTVSAYNAALEDARSDLANAGVSAATIAELQTLFDTAPDRETQTKAAQSLATSLFIRNTGDDRKNAIALVENVVADTANTPRSRAIAQLIRTKYGKSIIKAKTRHKGRLFVFYVPPFKG